MKCHRCDWYKWEDGLPIVYTDSDGRGYCVFHVPKDKKGMDGKSFRIQVILRIDQFKKNAVPKDVCKFDGTIFHEDIDLSRYNNEDPLPSVSFVDAVFWGKAFFRGVNFKGSALFSDSHFKESADFSFATICDWANFNDAEFKCVRFNSTVFEDTVNFYLTKFNEKSFFVGTTFGPNADFSTAEFEDIAEFAHSTFNGRCCFGDTKFGEETSFKGVTFVKKLQIAVESGGKINFDDAIFNEQTFFNNKFYKSASFCSITAEKGLVFRNIKPLNAWFPYSKMDNIRFEDCGWKTENDKKGGRIHVSLEDENLTQALTQAEDFYRRMKQKYKNENNEGEASRWHLAEKEVYRKRLSKEKGSRFLRFALGAYRWSSGYGEDPWRAAKSLVWLLGACFVLLGFIGVESNEKIISVLSSPSFSLQGVANLREMVLTTLKSVLLFKQSEMVFYPSSHWLEVLFIIVSRVFIPVQAALLAFALRNKFRR